MDAFGLLFEGIQNAATPTTLLATLFGVIIGLLIGALPGLGPSAGVAIMLPVAVSLGGVPALACLAGIYYGSMFGGAITSILLGIPGDPPSIMTVVDGHPLAKKGEAGRALGMSVFGSFIGGLVGLIGLATLSAPIARAALAFGPTEMTAIMVLALSMVSVLGGRNAIKGFTALAIGFWLGMIGLDPIAGPVRFTFGSMELFDGLDFSVVAVGLFGLTAMFTSLNENVTKGVAKFELSALFPRVKDAVRSRIDLLQGAVTGFFVGVLPGIGATAATMMAYAASKRMSKTPEKYGTGIVEGIAAPEAANNSASYSSMIPLFTLGIPGSATTAVMMGGLLMLGLQPGPLLFVNNGDFIWTVFGSFWIGNVMLVFLTLLLTPLLASLLFISTAILYPMVFAIIVFGVFSIGNSMSGVTIALLAGFFGLILIKLDYPPVPLVLGLILGPMLERNIRRTQIQSQGDVLVFVERPIALTLFVLTAIVLLLPVAMKLLRKKKPLLAETSS
ncbi:tripartite tricarboxylate transporter permease [Chelativorans sp. M5D2P16]|uniref:tripartite tricarboxylate transporter permease n=1 Tax=Chelativorans sp. M5D2P16 TaxID=3095678 RepID=UPI002ACA4543|nr:tripartite tricarboxylate transporter permease [Chelativorans sp. M5D2P16]MDZ5699707.1 tripartite tricarboxylate transporter permease [Chelativorans sp. M5D2P16]